MTTSQEVVYERMSSLARDVRPAHEAHLPARRSTRSRVRSLLHRSR